MEEHTYGFYQMRDEEDASQGVVTAELGVKGALNDMFHVGDVVEVRVRFRFRFRVRFTCRVRTSST